MVQSCPGLGFCLAIGLELLIFAGLGVFFILVLDTLPELSSVPVISISGLVSGGSCCGAVRPPVGVRWVALLPPHLLFRALAAAVTVWSCRRPLVVFLASPVSFLGTVRSFQVVSPVVLFARL